MSNGLLINEYNVFGIRNPPVAGHLTGYNPQAWQTIDSGAVNWGTFSALKTKVDTFLDPAAGQTIAAALDSLGEIQTFLANDGGGFGTAMVSSLGLKADKAAPIFTGNITFKNADGSNTVGSIVGASGNTSFAGTLTVGGNTTLSGLLTVTGATTFNDNISIAAGKTLTVGNGATVFGGTVTLAAAPTADLQASTKKYVDDTVAAVDTSTLAPKASPTFTGTMTLPAAVSSATATVLTLTDNAAKPFTISSTGKDDILSVVTTDSSEGVTMSGTLAVTGATSLTGTLTLPTAVSSATATVLTLTDNAAKPFTISSTGKADILSIITTDSSEGVSMSGTLGVTGVSTLAGITGTGAINLTGGTTTVAAPSADTHASTKKYVDDTVGAISLTEFASVQTGDGSSDGVVSSKDTSSLLLRQGSAGGTIKIDSGAAIDTGNPAEARLRDMTDLTEKAGQNATNMAKVINGVVSQQDYMYGGGTQGNSYLLALELGSDQNGKTLNSLTMNVSPGAGYAGTSINHVSYMSYTFGYATAAQVAAGNSPTTSAFLLNVTGATSVSNAVIGSVNTGTPYPIVDGAPADNEFHVVDVRQSAGVKSRCEFTTTFDGSRTMATGDFILIRHGWGDKGTGNAGQHYHATGNITIGTAGSGAIEMSKAIQAASTLAVTGALTASSTAAITGNTTIGGTLGVTGVSTLAGITGTGAINLTGGTTTVATPTADTHASTKAYVDQVAQGLDVKESCRVGTTANITLNDVQAVDGITLVAGNRVLVKDQTTGSENGIYVVVAGGDWTRATDFDGTPASEVTPGAFAFVEEGTANANAGFTLSTTGAITIGTTALTFTQFSSAGAVTAGTGLSKSGNTLSVDAAQTQITSVGTLAGLTATGTINLTGGTTTVAAPSADTHASTKKYVDDTVGAINLTEFASVQTGNGSTDGVVQSKGTTDLLLRRGSAGGTIKIAAGDAVDTGNPAEARLRDMTDLTEKAGQNATNMAKVINGVVSQQDYMYGGGTQGNSYLLALELGSDQNGKTLNSLTMNVSPGAGYAGTSINHVSYMSYTFGYATAAQVAAGNSPTTSAFLLNVTGATSVSNAVIGSVNTGTPYPIVDGAPADNEFHVVDVRQSAGVKSRCEFTTTFDGSRTMATGDFILIRHGWGDKGTGNAGQHYHATGNITIGTAGSDAIEVSAGIEAAGTLAVTGDATFVNATGHTITATNFKVGSKTIVDASSGASFTAMELKHGGTVRGLMDGETGNVNFSGTLSVDTIGEKTAAAGVTIDGVLVKDNKVTATNFLVGSKTIVDASAGASFTAMELKHPVSNGTTRVLMSGETGNATFAGTLGVSGVSTLAGITGTGVINLTGGTTTVAAPSADTHASTKKYVDDSVGAQGTEANTANTLVKRDANGNFAANRITTTVLVTGGVTNAQNVGAVDVIALNTRVVTLEGSKAVAVTTAGTAPASNEGSVGDIKFDHANDKAYIKTNSTTWKSWNLS